MDLPLMVSPSHKISLIKTDKRNLKFDSIILLIIGISIFLTCAFIFGTEGMIFYFILSLFYLVSGSAGLIGIKKKSSSWFFVFKILNFWLIAVNLCFALLGCFYFVYSMGLYMDCNRNYNDSCAAEIMAAIIIEFLCILEVTMSCSMIVVLLVINKHVNFYTDDLFAINNKRRAQDN